MISLPHNDAFSMVKKNARFLISRIKMIIKELIKNSLFALALMATLISVYLLNKDRDYNPFLQKLNTGTEVVTIQELKGAHKLTFLYFGFLSCPDVCPTTLGNIASIFKEMPKEKLDQIAFVFVDVDPERDKVEDLKNYTSFFDPKIIPASIPPKELDLFTRHFGVVYMKVPLDSEMGYTIDHSTDIIVLNSEGKRLESIHHNLPRRAIAAQINKMFDEN